MTKYVEYRSKLPRVSARYPELAAGLELLERQQDDHFAFVNHLLAPTSDDGTAALFEVDIVLLSIANRSLDLIDGFLATFDRWNFSTAAPLVRLQVDNLMRATILQLAPPNTLTTPMLAGKNLSKVPDPLRPDGTKVKLTDQRLCQHASTVFDWLDLVYRQSSGWVHFSGVHVGVTMKVDDDGRIESRFPSDIDRYPFEFVEQVLWAMLKATDGLLEVLIGFAQGKAAAAERSASSDDAKPT